MNVGLCNVVCITTRPQIWYGSTSQWMVQSGIFVDALYMRGDKDFRTDAEYRASALREILDKAKSVLFAVDDTDKACDVYRAAGIPTLQLTNPSNGELS